MNRRPPSAPWQLAAAPPRPAGRVVPDAAQRRVVDRVATPGHGPLLVLAGPGTGKTTTIVAAVAARVAAGTDPERILTLTFSRKAAQELRGRIGTELGRTVGSPLAWTFHGFGYSLLARTRPPEDAEHPLRLLSGAEQDVVVRELLAGGVDLSPDRWPRELAAALPTRGFTEEVRALISRARSLGMQPADLAAAASGRPDWAAAAAFLDEYLVVLDASGAVDYAELIARAVSWAETPQGQAELRSSYDLVVVDEYQDTDPGQERLLQAIAGDGRDLMVVGDPDQSIYAFRGASVDAIWQFRDRFRALDGEPADVAVLRTCRRSGAGLLAASRAVASRLPKAGAGLVEHLREHHQLEAAYGLPVGRVDVVTYPTDGQQAAAIADLLRRQHLQHGRPWSDMAVLVRSGVTSIPPLHRALQAHGVPVDVAGDELPLAQAPAVACLVLALQVVDDPAALTPATAQALLVSPLVAADPADIRRLGRALREEERAAGTPPGLVPSSAELVRDAVADGRHLAALSGVATPARTLARLLEAARAVNDAGGSVHEVLWALWDGAPWRHRLLRAADRGGPAGRAADRDLDAVVALFDAAARTDIRSRGRRLRSFLAELRAQQIPADTLAERSARPGGVRLMTAHRSKGLEWPLVVVAGVQEEAWPDLRTRGSLLEADRLSPSGPAEAATVRSLLDEERRLFYVAVTRAKDHLVVTAVDSDDDDGQRASRFLPELGVAVRQTAERPARPLTLTGLTAELRATVVDPHLPAPVRAAAASRLARLADAEVLGHRLVPAADPEGWWGMLPVSRPATTVRPVDEPIELSGSSLANLVECPLRWFLSHEVHAQAGRGTAMGIGSVVHAVADGVATGEVAADAEVLMEAVDAVWRQLQFAAAWESDQQRDDARSCIVRFLAWHRKERGRQLIGSEETFSVDLPVGERTVRLRGRLDRVELDHDGRVVVVDFKTSKNAPTQAEVDEHLQLAVYQRAVQAGAVTDRSSTPGGAELVQLRQERRGEAKVQRQPAMGSADDGTAGLLDEALAAAVATLAAEDFRAVPGRSCGYCEYVRSCPARDEGRGLVQ